VVLFWPSLFREHCRTMSEEMLSELIANNTSLTDSLAQLLADKAAMEKRMGHQISKLRSEGENKRKSTEMDDTDCPFVDILHRKLEETQNELTYARAQNADSADLIKSLRAVLKNTDEELTKARVAKDKMQYDANKHVLDNAQLWKDKNDDLKNGNLGLKAKYEKLAEVHTELAGKYEKLKTQYVKEHDELKNIKRMRGPSSSAPVPKVKHEYLKEEVDENTNELQTF